jgi:Na+/H+ antiporter NhaD/arsenite permease-like protein
MDSPRQTSTAVIRLHWWAERQAPIVARSAISALVTLVAAVIGGMFAMGAIWLLAHQFPAATAPTPPTWIWYLPFVILLAAIAWLPWKWPTLWGWIGFPISGGLALLVVLAFGWRLHTLVPIAESLSAYLQFMAVISAFYIICTNMRLTITCAPTPRNNLIMLFSAAVVANIIGTCGATVLFIGPFIALNRSRLTPRHIFFFVAIVANIGGLLTPLGDPPLMAGYLYGVPFNWMLIHAWPMWCVAMLWLLTIFYFLQRRSDRLFVATQSEASPAAASIIFENMWLLAPLAVGICALFLPSVYRVGLLATVAIGVAMACRTSGGTAPTRGAGARPTTPQNFGYRPLREMASLFLGIFITMTPVLAMIGHLPESTRRWISSPPAYFAAVGAASSVLDNTPTYIAGLQAKISSTHTAHTSSKPLAMPSQRVITAAADPKSAAYLLAIAMGAVMFGAMTWIGNGPNLLIEMISRQQGIRCPSFGTYIWRYSIPLLLPLFAIIALWLWMLGTH